MLTNEEYQEQELDIIARAYIPPPKWTAYTLAADFGDDPELVAVLEKQLRHHKREYKRMVRFVPIADPELSWVHHEVNRLRAEQDYGVNIKILETVHTLVTQPKDAPTNNAGVTDAQIEQARTVPITTILEFKHGFASCQWHLERTGSLHIIPNTNECRAYCHGACGRSYDAIDAYMLTSNCGFITAVRALCN
jgi:hypothetical protein